MGHRAWHVMGTAPPARLDRLGTPLHHACQDSMLFVPPSVVEPTHAARKGVRKQSSAPHGATVLAISILLWVPLPTTRSTPRLRHCIRTHVRDGRVCYRFARPHLRHRPVSGQPGQRRATVTRGAGAQRRTARSDVDWRPQRPRMTPRVRRHSAPGLAVWGRTLEGGRTT